MPSRTRRLTGTGRCRCGPPWPASARWPASPPVRLMKTPPMYAAYPASASAASAHPEPRPSVTDTSGLPVDLRVLAKTGATTNSMQQQVTLSARYRPGIAVVLIGSNDTSLPAPINRCTRYFGHAVGQLRDAGWEVVVMPCADPGAAPGFRIGVRWLASPRARRLARRQSCIAQRFGARVSAQCCSEICPVRPYPSRSCPAIIPRRSGVKLRRGGLHGVTRRWPRRRGCGS